MLSKKQFEINLNMLLTAKDIIFNANKNDCLYHIIKEDFEDREFSNMCLDICKKENLYNKYPDPKLFYDRKPKIDPETEFNIAQMAFIDKCEDYIQDEMPSHLNLNFNEIEQNALRLAGGLGYLWKQSRSGKGEQYLISELKRCFTCSFSSFEIVGGKYQIKSSMPTYCIEQVKLLSESKKCS